MHILIQQRALVAAALVCGFAVTTARAQPSAQQPANSELTGHSRVESNRGERVVASGVSYTFSTDEGAHLSAVLVGGHRGGHFSLAMGTLVTSDDAGLQDLVIGQSVEVDLQPHERRVIPLTAFCVHQNRDPTVSQKLRVRDYKMPAAVVRAMVDGASQEEVWGLLAQLNWRG